MLLYNGQFIPEQELRLPLTNRAFQYGDGFFETVMVVDGKLRFWTDHLNRMTEAASALRLELPSYFLEHPFAQDLLQLAESNNALEYGRLKLKVWRAGAGLYTPETNNVDWLATVSPAEPAPVKSIKIGICQSVKTLYSSLSHFKGPNAPIYVLAGLEKKQAAYDDMLLLNSQGMVAELVSSNVFWLLDGKLFTPALDTGCVNGIARRNILRWCSSQSIKVREAYFSPDRLSEAEVVFAANVTGIRGIKQMKAQLLRQSEEVLYKLRAELFT